MAVKKKPAPAVKAKQLVKKQPEREELLGDPAPPILTAEVEDVAEVAPPSDADLKRVTDLAVAQVKLAERIAKGEELLKTLNGDLKRLSEVDLPEAMNRIGMKMFQLKDGSVVEIATSVHASIPKDLVPTAHKFLEDHGNEGMIKRQIQILFGRGQTGWAKKFLADCAKRKLPLDLKEKEWVDPQTLTAWARGNLKTVEASGGNLEEIMPTALFGVFKRTYAKITEGKK